jgi:hypothetical protein
MPEDDFLDMVVKLVSDYWLQMAVKPEESKDKCMNRSLLFDDGSENIRCAEKIKCHSQIVENPHVGMSQHDWNKAMNTILTKKTSVPLEDIPIAGDSACLTGSKCNTL